MKRRCQPTTADEQDPRLGKKNVAECAKMGNAALRQRSKTKDNELSGFVPLQQTPGSQAEWNCHRNSKGLVQRSADAEIGQRTNRKEVELLKPQSLDMDEGLSSVWGLQHHNGGCPEGYGPFIDQCCLFTIWNLKMKALHRLGLES